MLRRRQLLLSIGRMNRFVEKLGAHGPTLRRAKLQTLQLNIGRKCNQACRHCPVDAAPWRTEMVDEITAHRIGAWVTKHRSGILDITGGAPELSEFFRYFVETGRAADAHIIDRKKLTITNQPIARFARDLREQNRCDEYLDLLSNGYNPATIDGLMCRNTLSVGYGGELYKCDFNRMLGLAWRNGKPLHLWDVTPERLEERVIATGDHCLACTAGTGSSCSGALS